MTDANDQAGVDVEYDPEEDAYRGSFVSEETNASTAVAASVAAVNHGDPMDLEPLYYSIDTDALDAIVASADSADVSVTFVVEGHDVTVRGDGSLRVDPPPVSSE